MATRVMPEIYRLAAELHWLAAAGDEAGLKCMVSRGVDVNLRSPDGRTVLHCAVEHGQAALVGEILAFSDIKLDAVDNEDLTAFLLAAKLGKLEVMRVLLGDKRVDCGARDKHGMTALSWAAKMDHMDVVFFLLETGRFDKDMKDHGGETALVHVIRQGNKAVAGHLVGKSEDAHSVMKKLESSTLSEVQETTIHSEPYKPRKEHAADPEKRPYNNLHVRNLPAEWTDADLMEAFKVFGEIGSATIMTTVDKATGAKKSRGFGFVCFTDAAAAPVALEAMHEHKLEGIERPLLVSKFQPKHVRQAENAQKYAAKKKETAERYAGCDLYVKNLEDEVSDEKLKSYFEGFGAITSAKVMCDAVSGQSRGFGFVCFEKKDDAMSAFINMNGKVITTKPIVVAIAQKREDRNREIFNKPTTLQQQQQQHQQHQQHVMPMAPMYGSIPMLGYDQTMMNQYVMAGNMGTHPQFMQAAQYGAEGWFAGP